MVRSLVLFAMACVSPAFAAGAEQAKEPAKDPAKEPSKASEPVAPDPAKKELLKLMDALELKLPPELARKLIILSMKIETGYLSPYQAKEFEDEVSKTAEADRKKFDAEWKVVREHPSWPRLPPPKKEAPPEKE